jgi:frataxin-like iron-binding protein CyaY
MTNFRNLKIAINDQQPLDEVVKELKRIGFYIGFVDYNDKWISARSETKLIVSFESESMLPDSHWKLTTLAELKEM